MNNTDSKHNFDDLLVKRYQNGENEALTILIKRFHQKLIRIIRYQIQDSGPANDIAQECWYSIIENLPDLKLKISFNAWATCIARRKAIDWIREQQQTRDLTRTIQANDASKIENREVDDDGDDEEHLKKIRMGIQQLPPTQRIILDMFYLNNLSLLEISDVLNIPKGTVKSRLFHAREKLKNIIAQQTEH